MTLPTILSLALLIGQPTPRRIAVKALQTFDVGDVPCELRVIDKRRPALNETIVIACNHSNLLTYDLGLADVIKIELSNTPAMGSIRVFVTFESGLNVTLVVFDISSLQDKATAHIIYEHSSHIGAETFEDGDVILEHVQRRFEAGATSLPGGTNLYRWQDGRYTFIEGFRWNRGTSWTDRYCILSKPGSCPAERTKARIFDEYEP